MSLNGRLVSGQGIGWTDNSVVVVNGSMSRCRSVMSGVPQVCLGTVALQFLYQRYSEIQCTLTMPVDDWKLSGAFYTRKGFHPGGLGQS